MQKGDLLLFVADKHSIVFNALGHVRLETAKKLNVIDENEFNFLYVTEFPMFEYDEEAGRYVAMHHPVHLLLMKISINSKQSHKQ